MITLSNINYVFYDHYSIVNDCPPLTGKKLLNTAMGNAAVRVRPQGVVKDSSAINLPAICIVQMFNSSLCSLKHITYV